MDSFWLTFSDPRLEQQYRRFLALQSLRTVDCVFTITQLCIRAVAVSRFWSKAVEGGLSTSFWTIVDVCWLLFQLAVVLRMNSAKVAVWRTPLIVTSRWVLLATPH